MVDLDDLIERWENSALELREAETLINTLIVQNAKLETAICIYSREVGEQDFESDGDAIAEFIKWADFDS